MIRAACAAAVLSLVASACGADLCPLPPGCEIDLVTCDCKLGRPPLNQPQPPSELCDHSAGMRVMFASGGGGFPTAESRFVALWSTCFFVIDGSCRYYAQDNPAHTIVSGTLAPEQATQLSADIAWFQLPAWGSHHQSTCADGPGSTLGIQGIELACGGAPQIGCGCDETAPAGLQAAQNNADAWLTRLVAQGAPLTGPILARAYAREPDVTTRADAWPLVRSMTSIPDLIVDAQTFDRAARIADPMEAAQLRALRAAHPEIARTASFRLDVRDAGKDYALYLRDEIPEADVRAVESLAASWRQD